MSSRKEMAKKQKRKLGVVESIPVQEKAEFSEKTIKIYKRILKVMSWAVGISFILIIVLHLFNNEFLDAFAKYLFRFGVINLIAFTVLEFIGDTVKHKIERIIKVFDESKSTIS